jgi:hypothetical protein
MIKKIKDWMESVPFNTLVKIAIGLMLLKLIIAFAEFFIKITHA